MAKKDLGVKPYLFPMPVFGEVFVVIIKLL